jgi:vacuolar-type H+-ATPase subunit I/STV1
MFRKNTLIGLFLLSMALCAHSQGMQPSQDSFVNELRELNKKYSLRYEAPIFDALKTKISVFGRAASLSQLSDSSKPSESERKALEALYEVRKSQWAEDLAIHRKYRPQYIEDRKELFIAAEKLLINLYSSNINYGQFNLRNKEITEIFVTAVKKSNLEANKKLLADKQQQLSQQQNNAQKAATCTQLRSQLKARIEQRDSWLEGFKDATAWTQGGTAGPTAALSARSSQKAQEQEQINQFQQYIINYCGGL